VKITAKQYWDADLIYAFMLPLAEQGIEPYATWLKLPPDAVIAPYNETENINIVMAGGETNPLWLTTDLWYTVSASIDE
jgi:hypothetical protein